MNCRWPIIALLAISCNHHPTPVVKSNLVVSDTATTLPALAADTNHQARITPAVGTSHPAQITPGPPLIFTTDLNNDAIPDTIAISSSTADTASFDIISITLASIGKKTIHTPNPWTAIDNWFYLDYNKNAIPTGNFYLTKGKTQSVLLLFGHLYDSGREGFYIINIENNKAKLVLDQDKRDLDVEVPISLDDQDGDGRLDFVYRQIFEYSRPMDSLNGQIGIYSPYYVYTIDDKCELNKSLTRRYNEANYVFAGFKYNEDIEVFYPNDKSKPRFWKK